MMIFFGVSSEGEFETDLQGFEIEINCKEANGEWEADIRIAPNARGIDSIVPVFGNSSKDECRSAALELAKEHIDRITREL